MTSQASAIGDRHLLDADGLAPSLNLAPSHVRVVVAPRWGETIAGQLIASCLINLLCRQVGMIAGLDIVATETKSLIKLPSGEDGGRFTADLQRIATWAVSVATDISIDYTAMKADHTIYIGDEPIGVPDDTLVVVGGGWKAWIGHKPGPSLIVVPDSTNPFGPFLAAALAAGEIFKRCRGLRRGKFLKANGYSLWSGEDSHDWHALEDGPDIAKHSIPPLHLVGAGAVGNDLAYILANSALSEGYVVTIDDDTYNDTNLNRCLLAGWQDQGASKSVALARVLKAHGVDAWAYRGSIREYLAANRNGLRADVATSVDNLDFPIVVSCVDKGGSRQDIQGLNPKILLGGSTLGMSARSNYYADRLGSACLGCFNPSEKDGEKIRQLMDKLKGMANAERANFLVANKLDPDVVEEYLTTGQCGSLGETALRDFAIQTPSQFSVGFVSLGAALLLGTELVRQTLFLNAGGSGGDMKAFGFLNGGFMNSNLAVDEACEYKCQERRRIVCTAA